MEFTMTDKEHQDKNIFGAPAGDEVTNTNAGGGDSQPGGETPPAEKKYSAVSEFFDYVEIFVFSVCAVMLLFTFALRLCRVDGDSMERTLADGEILVVADINYTPKINDIVVFHMIGAEGSPYNKPIVKRVIADAGHFVKIDYIAGLVYVSKDNVFDESDIINESAYIFLDNGKWDMYGTYEGYVPEGYIFVLGDNRNNSADSRYEDIGLVDVRRVFGKVLVRIYPLSVAGSVY